MTTDNQLVNSPFEIRPLEPGDLAAVCRLAQKSKASWGYSDAEMKIFAGELTLTESGLTTLVDARVAVGEKGN